MPSSPIRVGGQPSLPPRGVTGQAAALTPRHCGEMRLTAVGDVRNPPRQALHLRLGNLCRKAYYHLEPPAVSLLTTAAVGGVAQAAVPLLSHYQRLSPAVPTGARLLLGASGLVGIANAALLGAAVVGYGVQTLRHRGDAQPPIGRHHPLARPEAWASFAAVTQGLALAPLLAQGTAVCWGPAGWVAMGCLLGITYLVSHRATGDATPSFSALACTLIMAAILGPLGWDINAGTLPLEATARALLAASLMAGGYALLQLVWQLHLNYAPTPYIGNFLCSEALIAKQRLDLNPDNPRNAPTIFNVSEPLRAAVQDLQAKRGPLDTAFEGWRGTPMIVLGGPPGCGKTLMAQGIANALHGELVATNTPELAIDDVSFAPIAGLNLLRLIAEAELYGRRQAKPVVIFVDEVDGFLPNEKISSPKNQAELNRACSLGLLHVALKFLNESIGHVVVVFATNYVAKITPALSLLTTREPLLVSRPNQSDLQRLLTQKLEVGHQQLNEMGVPIDSLTASADDKNRVKQLAGRIVTARFNGRDVESLVKVSFSAILAAHGRCAEVPPDYRAVFFETLERRLSDMLEASAQKQPRPQPQEFTDFPPLEPMHAQPLLQALGLTYIEPRLVVRLIESIANMILTDPRRSIRLGQVLSRASLAAYQLFVRAAAASLAASGTPHRDFNDISRT